MPQIEAICISRHKGEQKVPVDHASLVMHHGIEGDAHAGSARQISLLAVQSIAKMVAKGIPATPGIFAENLVISGLNLVELPIGTRLQVGINAVLELTQIGKECHTRCAIFHQVGDCVMPKEGVFAKVVASGTIAPGQKVEVIYHD